MSTQIYVMFDNGDGSHESVELYDELSFEEGEFDDALHTFMDADDIRTAIQRLELLLAKATGEDLEEVSGVRPLPAAPAWNKPYPKLELGQEVEIYDYVGKKKPGKWFVVRLDEDSTIPYLVRYDGHSLWVEWADGRWQVA